MSMSEAENIQRVMIRNETCFPIQTDCQLQDGVLTVAMKYSDEPKPNVLGSDERKRLAALCLEASRVLARYGEPVDLDHQPDAKELPNRLLRAVFELDPPSTENPFSVEASCLPNVLGSNVNFGDDKITKMKRLHDALFTGPVAQPAGGNPYSDLPMFGQEGDSEVKALEEAAEPEKPTRTSAMRIVLNGQAIPIVASGSWCESWRDRLSVKSRVGFFRLDFSAFAQMPEPRPDLRLLGKSVRVELLDEKEWFQAIVTAELKTGVYHFVSDGPPSLLQEAAEPEKKVPRGGWF